MRVARPWRNIDDSQAHPLVQIFYSMVREQRASIHDVADRSGVPYATIQGWRHRYSPTLVTLEAVLNVLGYRLAIVPAGCVKPHHRGRYERKIYDRHPRVTHDSQSPAANGVAYDAASHEGGVV